MTAILFAPHNDDETLFAAFHLLRERDLESAAMHTIVVLRSFTQEEFGVTFQEREAETRAACGVLGCTLDQWIYPDTNPPWQEIQEDVALIDAHARPHRVYAPAVESGGQEHHNRLGEICALQFGERLQPYLTYTNEGGYRKSRSPNRVPFAREWITLKLRALACYESQHRIESGSHRHFTEDLMEFTP